jgi:hypothetical protein
LFRSKELDTLDDPKFAIGKTGIKVALEYFNGFVEDKIDSAEFLSPSDHGALFSATGAENRC